MSVIDRIESLKTKHAELAGKIEKEEVRPHPDDALIHDLKRQKLKVKDEISTLATQ
ncbi:YdcH family protein [Terasakiella sp. SH-1]|uniref:YdcH family protein n=1 Tax=Terasakiella sp. SH-1 TaxID=2560057 RepID=UPI001073EA52|nr:YdcH family protein [Terasakiella sp. SH-1]